MYKDFGFIRSSSEGWFCCILPGRYNSTETLKPLMESKVLKVVHKGNKTHFAVLRENRRRMDGWSDLSGGIKGNVEVVLVALMCEHDSLAVCGVLCGLCPCCQIISFSFSPTCVELSECDSVQPDVFTHLHPLNELSFLPSFCWFSFS